MTTLQGLLGAIAHSELVLLQLELLICENLSCTSIQLDSDEQILKNSLKCGKGDLGIWAVKASTTFLKSPQLCGWV